MEHAARDLEIHEYRQARLKRPDLVVDLQQLYVDALQQAKGLMAEQVWQAEDRPSLALR